MTIIDSRRLDGFDVARAIAVFGMFVVHAFLILGPPYWALVGIPHLLFNFCDGRAAATFVLLAGLGVGHLLERVPECDRRYVLWRRSAFLGALGVLNLAVWPGDILRLYGIALFVAAFLFRLSARALGGIALFLLVAFPTCAIFIDWDARWDWLTLTYSGLWTPSGFVLNLVIDGFRPLIPWLAFFVLGLVLARLNWRSPQTSSRILCIGGILFLVAESTSVILLALTKRGSLEAELGQETLSTLFGTHSMPPMPLFVLSALGVGMICLGSGFILARILPQTVRSALACTGRLALTWYLVHIMVLVAVATFNFGNRLSAWQTLKIAVAAFIGIVIISRWRNGEPTVLERSLRRFSKPGGSVT
ncbi:MAG: heparan-alpha-glucosaminide N-acetyltransferase domain-containing protein [Acidobacteriota bacterium]